MSGPNVLILGGLGTCGRSLLKYIIDYDLAAAVRVVDKAVPSMAYLGPFAALLDDPRVEHVQANLATPDHVSRAFAPSAKIPGFQLVVNFAAETRHGLPDEVYADYVSGLRRLCAAAAASCRTVEKYVEVSTAHVYDGDKANSATEADTPKPWTALARHHLVAEQAALATPGLPVCVLRLPLVYGPGDKAGLMPRIICAWLYAQLGDTMELLWGSDLRIDTVHVQDVAACCWHLLVGGENGSVYNLSDGAETTQGKLNKVFERAFGTKTGFYGLVANTLAKARLDAIVEEANEAHLGPWDDVCREGGIHYTPLSPYLDPELLAPRHTAVAPTKIEATGFQVSCPAPTEELLREAVQYWQDLKVFPAARH